MMIRAGVAAAFLLISAPATSLALETPITDATAPSLEWMVGSWSGYGKMFGQHSKVSLVVRSVAGAAAYSFDYEAVVAAQPGGREMRFAAHAFFQKGKDNRWHGRWVDSAGNLHDVYGLLEPGAMTSTWGSPSTEIGRSNYTLVEGKMRITDSVLGKDNMFKAFAQSDLTRE
jgi:hypothetical protein